MNSVKDVYEGDGHTGKNSNDEVVMYIGPICLPSMTTTKFEKDTKLGSLKDQFEDMDCISSFKPESRVPNPTDVQVSYKPLTFTEKQENYKINQSVLLLYAFYFILSLSH